MNSFTALLIIGLLLTGTAWSQTRLATAPAATTANQSATTPASTTATPAATNRPAARPATTSASSTTASPNRRQELYDQYHGYNKKPGSPAPATPAERRASRPAPAAEPDRPVSPAGTESIAGTKQPVSSDVGNARVRIGVRGGITRLVYLEKLVGAEPTAGFVGGFVLNFGRGAVSFQPELNYARYAKKATIKNITGTGSSSEITLTEAIDRFEIPLLVKFASGSANSTRFFLNVGPYGGYTSGTSRNGQNASDNATNRFSYGAAGGVGVALKAGPGHATIEVRGLYQLGITNNSVSTDPRAINAQATVGYMLPLGGR